MTSGIPRPTGETEPAVASRAATVARRLRTLAGVREDVLAWVPHETGRHTALGGVVLGTAAVATVSMFFALEEILGGFSVWMLPLVLGWGVLVCNLDRWLVASSTGAHWRRRLGMLLPRLLLAAVFGVVIAEPIVLKVFESAIVKHVEDGRAGSLDQLRDQLVRCNPVPGTGAVQPPADQCRDRLLTVAGSPAAVAGELSRIEADAETLRGTVERDSARLGELNEEAQRECVGVSGPGLTGRAGYGRQCLDRLAEAEQFAATHRIGEDQQRLAALRGRATELRGQLAVVQAGYQQDLTSAIDDRVRVEQDAQREVGLLERFRALDELVAGNALLTTVQWAVRLFFVLLDCLPVLVKLFGGTTGYDRMIDRLSGSRDRVFAAAVKAGEETELAHWNGVLNATQTGVRREKERHDMDRRRHESELNSELLDHIDSLTARNLHQLRNGHVLNGQGRGGR